MLLVIDKKLCSGCGRCVVVCPERLLTLEEINHHKTARIISSVRCNLCGTCIAACPLNAVILVK